CQNVAMVFQKVEVLVLMYEILLIVVR
ncbi:hypothetical protein IIS_05061, partial [Bacillus cereus VD131]